MRAAIGVLVALAAAAILSYSADGLTTVGTKPFYFPNSTGQKQTELWVDFNEPGALWFNPAMSTSGWSCTEWGGTGGLKWDCSGTAVDPGATLKLGFGIGCTETLTRKDWGWGARGGAAELHDPIAEVDADSDGEVEGCSVGGIAEYPDVAQAPGSESGSSDPPYAALAGGLAAAVLALGAGAWYARRRLS